MNLSDGSSRPHNRRSRSRYARAAIAALVLLAVIALLAPGLLRLAILQPARDVLFFHREVQPLSQAHAIERHRPAPTETVRLPADASHRHAIAIELDLWVPEHTPAPAVLLLHGSSPRGRRLGFNMLLAEKLRNAGWLVLTPDARGFGRSGQPEERADPEAWSVRLDLLRLVEYARAHPAGNGKVIAVGHSLGGSHILQTGVEDLQVAGVALIGPSRRLFEREPSWWEQVRFSGDRGMVALLPKEIVSEELRQQDILLQASLHAARNPSTRVLLMDGELEGERLVAILSEAANRKGPLARHVTVRGSHHYCGAYQLPWPMQTVFVRPDVFAACFEALQDFLDSTVESVSGDS